MDSLVGWVSQLVGWLIGLYIGKLVGLYVGRLVGCRLVCMLVSWVVVLVGGVGWLCPLVGYVIGLVSWMGVLFG